MKSISAEITGHSKPFFFAEFMVVISFPQKFLMICKDDFLIGCAVSLKQCLGMINGERDGSEATRAVVEAAKAVAGGNFPR